jgi:hypothetical protein
MGAPQIILIFLMCFEFAMSVVKAGEPRDNYDPVKALIGGAIMGGLLWWGGFF